jgi:hypothetical protein
MKLSDAHRAVIVKFVSVFPLPMTEELARVWTHTLAEQMKFSFPTEGWGHKSAGGTRPHSSDVIAMQDPFVGFDVLRDSGAPTVALALDGEALDLTGQVFEPVTAHNRIAPKPEDPDVPANPPSASSEVLDLLNAMLATVSAIAADQRTQNAILIRTAEGSKVAGEALLASLNRGVKFRF